MSNQFDELSKALATGMPRRTILRLFCATVAGAVLAPFTHLGTTVEAATRPTHYLSPSAQPLFINGHPHCPPYQEPLAINGTYICVGRHCDPPCTGDEVCLGVSSGSGICVPRTLYM